MSVLLILLEGFTSIFNPSVRGRDPGLEKLEKIVESYQTTSDRERLAGDWQAVQHDMSRAWQKVQASYE